MKIYKHYSFDLWLTLIKSNPDFKKERALWFHKSFNYKNKSIEEVELAFRQVDLLCNSINEKTGKNIDADEMYLMVISKINDDEICFSSIDVEDIYNQTEKILLKHLPLVYSQETYHALSKIKSMPEISCSILSNTAFIKGKTLRTILNQLELDSFFDFQIYSDEVGMSKPNESVFELMLNNTKALKNESLHLHDVIHIGDNVNADIKGAEKIGIHTLQINSNSQSILTLLN